MLPLPQLQIESASMLTKMTISSILCHNDTIYKELLKSIHYFKGGHAQTQFWSKFEITSAVVTLNIRSRSSKSN